MNPDAGKTLYYLHFSPFDTQFLKGTAVRRSRSMIDVTEVYITPRGDYKEKKVGENVRGNQANFSVRFETPLKKVLKFRLQKYLLQSIFRNGKHDWFMWKDHGGKSAKYIL